MSNFKKGDAAEVTKNNNEDNFFYYPTTLIRLPSKNNNNIFVEYLTLLDSSSKSNELIKEHVNIANVRPRPLNQVIQWFKVGDSVDAYCYSVNAWCPASVIDIHENSTYLIEFRGPNPNSEIIHQCSLRLHREWLHGDCVWVPPLFQQQQGKT